MWASLQKITSPEAVRSPLNTQAFEPNHCGTGREASKACTRAANPEMSRGVSPVGMWVNPACPHAKSAM